MISDFTLSRRWSVCARRLGLVALGLLLGRGGVGAAEQHDQRGGGDERKLQHRGVERHKLDPIRESKL
jgi:hypothetical protein